ncbi:hypothetical protein AB0B25_05245 [Nocardia sp. NPDC049190]|uniref:hypothetical protein n=1 Tax=Nocardia sp. NPDC049190 TaxID=3155650 RepID=UPI0033E636EA
MRELDAIEIGSMAEVVVERRSSWLRPTIFALLFVILGAVLVLLVVSNADFDTGPPKVTPTQGPCEPFCTQAPQSP